MALGFSLIDLDVGKAAPLLVVGAMGVGLWYIWNKTEQQKKAADAQAYASPLAAYQQAEDMALVASLTGQGGSSVPAGTTTPQGVTAPVQNPLLPVYSAPGNPAQHWTASADQVGASASSNGI